MTKNLKWLCLTGFLALICASHSYGGELKAVIWTVDNKPLAAAPGATLKVQITATIPPGYHIYSLKALEGSDPTHFSVEPQELLSLSGDITHPAPIHKIEKEINLETEYFEKSVTFSLPLKVARDAAWKKHEAAIVVHYMLCSEKTCFPPVTKKLNIELEVTSGPPAMAPQEPQLRSAPSEKKAEAADLWTYLGVAASAGAFALLTPCVFPMIPITVSFFTKRKHISRARAVRDAAIYALGIVFTFSGIGFAFALLLDATGITNLASSPWVNLVFAAIFIVLAFNLFGMFEIQIPPWILNKLNSKAGEGEGILSVLLMGLVFSLTSFTCTGPFIGAVMVSAAQGQWVWPLLGMIVFSTVFSAPFFLLALFPAALKSLPKSGGWLNSVKVVMGFLEIAAAMKFLSNADLVWNWGILTRNVFLSVWIGLAVLTVIYLLGRIRFPHDTPIQRVGAIRALTTTGFFSVALFLGTGLRGGDLGLLDSYIPSPEYRGAGRSSDGLIWLEDWEAAKAEAQKVNKPIFVDFTGHTCTNCRRMESGMFKRPEVSSLLKDYVRVRLYTDGRENQADIERSARNQRLQQERYGVVTLPFYALVKPDGNDLVIFPDGYTTDVGEFTQFLKRGQPSSLAAQN